MILNKALIAAMHDVLVRPSIQDFYDLGGTVFQNPNDHTQQCLYIKTSEDSKVLAVAHCDHVMFTYAPRMIADASGVKAPQLDDRLGVWTILAALPQCLPLKDMPYDILLTSNEEIGKSTGVLFNPPEGKQYNWIFEWDRRGNDVVMYDYKTKELEKLLEAHHFKVGWGSFTDIGVLDFLGCAAFNFGTCYYGEHSKDCHADIPLLIKQIGLFKDFYINNYNTHLVGDQEEAKKARVRKTTYLYDAPKGNVQADNKAPFTQVGQGHGLKLPAVLGKVSAIAESGI